MPDLAQILNKAMNSQAAASKLVPGADFTQLLILRHLFVTANQIARKWLNRNEIQTEAIFLEFNFL